MQSSHRLCFFPICNALTYVLEHTYQPWAHAVAMDYEWFVRSIRLRPPVTKGVSFSGGLFFRFSLLYYSSPFSPSPEMRKDERGLIT